MVHYPKREANDPTPEQIRRSTAAIRAGWTDLERVRRSSEKPASWSPPVFASTSLSIDEVEQN